jgi:hypothetical protein
MRHIVRRFRRPENKADILIGAFCGLWVALVLIAFMLQGG